MKRSKRKYIRQVVITAVVLFLAIQFIRPKIDNLPATGDFKAPPEVKSIIERACYDCHSNATKALFFINVKF